MRRGGIPIALAVLLFAAVLVGCDSGSSSGGSEPSTRESVTVVAQNLLHGFACAEGTDRCKLPQRVQLFARQLDEADCPQVVAVEESDPVMGDLLVEQVKTTCDGRYEVVGLGDPGSDRELVLTTLPVLGQERTRLAGPLRDALWVRVGAPLGPLDVVATHLASGSDDRPCDSSTCPPPCKSSDTLNTCQGRQAAALLASHLVPESVGVLIGDLNARPGDATINALTKAGLTDTFLAAGNAECDETTGVGCTGGRQDADLSDLTNPSAKQSSRIDFVFLKTARSCKVAKSSGLFAAEPASPPLDGLVFAADHTGVQATISCATTDRDLAEARPVASSSTTTTRPKGVAQAGLEGQEVAAAFKAVFNGGGTIETRLASLQDANLLRDSLVARYEDPATKPLADRVQVRLDGAEVIDRNHVNVTYSILLDGAAVLDHLPGAAVREDGRWLVTRQSYCQVATLGVTTVPEPCR